jgi:hypothetical protein
VVTDTATVPAACALVTALIWVGLVTVKLLAVVDPNLTAVQPVRFVPVIVTVVPPAVGPAVGAKVETVGGGTNRKCVARVPVPPGEITETATVPAACALVTALIWVGLETV